MNRNVLVEMLKNIDAFLGDELSKIISAIYTYGSNNKVLCRHLVSNELDLVFVFKTRSAQAKRNSDIDREVFSYFVSSIANHFEDTCIIFNGEYPLESNKYDFFIDILIDNIPSIAENHPTSKVTANLEKELIWGNDVYSELSHIQVTDDDLKYLAKQKVDYLDRVYSKRDDQYAIKTYLKSLKFIFWIFQKYGSKKRDFSQEIDDLDKIIMLSPSDVAGFVGDSIFRLISND